MTSTNPTFESTADKIDAAHDLTEKFIGEAVHHALPSAEESKSVQARIDACMARLGEP